MPNAMSKVKRRVYVTAGLAVGTPTISVTDGINDTSGPSGPSGPSVGNTDITTESCYRNYNVPNMNSSTAANSSFPSPSSSVAATAGSTSNSTSNNTSSTAHIVTVEEAEASYRFSASSSVAATAGSSNTSCNNTGTTRETTPPSPTPSRATDQLMRKKWGEVFYCKK